MKIRTRGGLKSMSQVLQLPSLEHLDLRNCKDMEFLVDEEEQDGRVDAFLWTLYGICVRCIIRVQLEYSSAFCGQGSSRAWD